MLRLKIALTLLSILPLALSGLSPLHALPGTGISAPGVGGGLPAAAGVPGSMALERLTIGQPATGRLDERSQVLPDGSRYNLYLYQGRPGEEIVIALQSGDFVPVLAGGPVVGGEFRADDRTVGGTDGTGAILHAVTGSDGTYGVWVNSVTAGHGGAYEITVQLAAQARRPGMPRQTLEAAAPGEVLQRSLNQADAVLADGSHYHLFVYTGEPGDEIIIDLRSEAFGTFLSAGALRGGTFFAAASDQERAGGSRSELRVRVGSDGRFAIRVNAYDPGATGEYVLSIRRVSTAEEGAGGSAEDELEGPLAGSDAVWARPVPGSLLDDAAGNETPGADRGVSEREFAPIVVHDPGAKPQR